MLNLDSLTTRKGAKIALHLEDESRIAMLELEWDQSGLQEKLRKIIDRRAVDTGPGTVVHLLANKDGNTVGVLTDDEFSKWQENPEWDHRPRSRMPDPLMVAALLASLGNFSTGMSLADLIGGKPKSGHFSGPTLGEMDKHLENPATEKIALKAAADKNCNLCIAPTGLCARRVCSFDLAAFEAAIAAYQP